MCAGGASVCEGKARVPDQGSDTQRPRTRRGRPRMRADCCEWTPARRRGPRRWPKGSLTLPRPLAETPEEPGRRVGVSSVRRLPRSNTSQGARSNLHAAGTCVRIKLDRADTGQCSTSGRPGALLSHGLSRGTTGGKQIGLFAVRKGVGFRNFEEIVLGILPGRRRGGSRSLQVVGAGFGRTGTHSLRVALDELGFGPAVACSRSSRIPDRKVPQWVAASEGKADWDAIFEGYASTVDFPSAGYWKTILAHYPDARVILSSRSAESWYDSFSETIAWLMASTPATLPPPPATVVADGHRPGRRDHTSAEPRPTDRDARRLRSSTPTRRT